MYKIKMFQGLNYGTGLEKEINKWLAKNGQIQVINIFTTVAEKRSSRLIMTILYKEKKNDKF